MSGESKARDCSGDEKGDKIAAPNRRGLGEWGLVASVVVMDVGC